MIPICQDTGMAVVFIEIGQDVHIVGENIEDAINQELEKDTWMDFKKISSKRSNFKRKHKG